ncbi:hypothetical protein HHI36_020925, partial [Cryptolaemus montrouzieri]
MEILEKADSVVLYRQSSLESLSNAKLNIHRGDESATAPKIVDATIKTKFTKLQTERCIGQGNHSKHDDEFSSSTMNHRKDEISKNAGIVTKTLPISNLMMELERSLAKQQNEKSEIRCIYSHMDRCSITSNTIPEKSEYLEMTSGVSENPDENKAERNDKNESPIYEILNPSQSYFYLQNNPSSVAVLKAFKTQSENINTEAKEKDKDRDTKEMATLRPKSPKPIITKNDKEESFWDKIGTLGRKKRIKEVQEVQEEGKYAIDSPGFAITPVIPPEEYELDENEERSIIMPKAYEDPKLRELIQVLIDWINDELASQRIIVQDLTEDLYDGQVLQKLFETLTGHKLDVPEVTQSEEGQKQKLSVVLAHFNKVLGLPYNHTKWNVEVIHSKSIVPILHLLVALARHFRPPVRLPENVSVSVTVVQKSQGQLMHRVIREVITSEYSDVGMRCERDAFDTLFDHAPDKLQVVKKSMVTFVNKHLNKLNLEVTEIETQFHDGVYLIMLMGLLEGFFVPLYSFFPTPKDNDQKVHNVSFAFELMEEVGLTRPKARPEDVVNLDLKSTLEFYTTSSINTNRFCK